MSDLMPYRATTTRAGTRQQILLPAPRRSPEEVRTVSSTAQVVLYDRGRDTARSPFSRMVQAGDTCSRRVRASLHRLRHRPTKARVARIVCFVPAHNEEADLARTLDALLAQTRRIDRIVVIADNCSDGTEAVARRYRDVTVMRTVDNQDKKVGALNQAWHQHARGYDFLLGVDADTVLAPDCVAQLEDEIVRKPNVAGIMARYTFDEQLATTWWARQLIRAQRLDFAQWLLDIGRRPERDTYVLGGQATLFRIGHLHEVVTQHERLGPWDPTAQVEDMELTWRLNEGGRKTLTSETARAYAGPMITLRALLGQRRKWDEGMIRLLLSHSIVDKNTRLPWRQNMALLTDGLLRVQLVLLLAAALMVHQYVWSWIWAVPPVLAALLNMRIAWYVPGRRFGDLLFGVLLFPAELWLLFRIYSTGLSWLNVMFGKKRDGWAAQAAAERGGGSGAGFVGKLVLAALLATVASGGLVYWWLTLAGPLVQRQVLTAGWGALAMLTAVRTISVVIKLLTPTRGYRP
ncbi:MAG TPA: glycosyltransferase family 2 protein [Jatrophihabitans sp.]